MPKKPLENRQWLKIIVHVPTVSTLARLQEVTPAWLSCSVSVTSVTVEMTVVPSLAMTHPGHIPPFSPPSAHTGRTQDLVTT